jgi:hypothetical protein
MTKVTHLMYHLRSNELKLSMIDVRRLLPEYNVRDFRDLRERELLPALEQRFISYRRAGGTMKGSEDTKNLASPSLAALPSLSVITRITRSRAMPDRHYILGGKSETVVTPALHAAA